MRILFVTGSLVHGGAERQAITLANRLAERGHECHFAYVKNDPSQLARLRRRACRCAACTRALSRSCAPSGPARADLQRLKPDGDRWRPTRTR